MGIEIDKRVFQTAWGRAGQMVQGVGRKLKAKCDQKIFEQKSHFDCRLDCPLYRLLLMDVANHRKRNNEEIEQVTG